MKSKHNKTIQHQISKLAEQFSRINYDALEPVFRSRVSKSEFQAFQTFISNLSNQNIPLDPESMTREPNDDLVINFRKKELEELPRSCALVLPKDGDASFVIETKSKMADGIDMNTQDKRKHIAQGANKTGKPCYFFKTSQDGSLACFEGFSFRLKDPKNPRLIDELGRELEMKSKFWPDPLVFYGKGQATYRETKGQTLHRYIHDHPSMSLSERVKIADMLCESLSTIHKAGFVHGDIKPDNIIVINGKAMLNDFGNIQPEHGLLRGSSADYKPLGRDDSGQEKGDIHYADKRMDLYALAKSIESEVFPRRLLSSIKDPLELAEFISIYKKLRLFQGFDTKYQTPHGLRFNNIDGYVDTRLEGDIDRFRDQLLHAEAGSLGELPTTEQDRFANSLPKNTLIDTTSSLSNARPAKPSNSDKLIEIPPASKDNQGIVLLDHNFDQTIQTIGKLSTYDNKIGFNLSISAGDAIGNGTSIVVSYYLNSREVLREVYDTFATNNIPDDFETLSSRNLSKHSEKNWPFRSLPEFDRVVCRAYNTIGQHPSYIDIDRSNLSVSEYFDRPSSIPLTIKPNPNPTKIPPFRELSLPDISDGLSTDDRLDGVEKDIDGVPYLILNPDRSHQDAPAVTTAGTSHVQPKAPSSSKPLLSGIKSSIAAHAEHAREHHDGVSSGADDHLKRFEIPAAEKYKPGAIRTLLTYPIDHIPDVSFSVPVTSDDKIGNGIRIGTEIYDAHDRLIQQTKYDYFATNNVPNQMEHIASDKLKYKITHGDGDMNRPAYIKVNAWNQIGKHPSFLDLSHTKFELDGQPISLNPDQSSTDFKP